MHFDISPLFASARNDHYTTLKITTKCIDKANCNKCIYKNSYLQNASVALLLVYLVNYVFDEDMEVFYSMVINNVTHIGNQNGLLDSVLKIHQEPEKYDETIIQGYVVRA